MDKKVLVRKLNTLKEDKDLSVFDQFNSVNEKLRAINGVLKSINIKEVKTYQEELKTLENAILNLTDSVKGKDMVVNIPLDQLSSKLDQVENAIKNIKEVKIPDFPNFPEVMSLNEVQVNELLLAIQSIPEFPKEDIIKLFKSLEKTISELKLEAPENEFDYDFLRTKFDSLIKAIKGISISVSGSGFPEISQNNLINIEANQTNGTQKTQIIDGLNIGSYDYFSLAQDTLTDTYTFKVGGASGTTVATVLITYTSADKSTISSVLKS